MPAVRRPLQPEETFRGIVYIRIVREVQLPQGILRVRQFLCRPIQPVFCLLCIWHQQSTITEQQSHKVLGVGVALTGDLLQLRSSMVPFLQRYAFVGNNFPQFPAVIRHTAVIHRLVLLRQGCILEGHMALADMLRLFYDSVLDLAELLLL